MIFMKLLLSATCLIPMLFVTAAVADSLGFEGLLPFVGYFSAGVVATWCALLLAGAFASIWS